MIKTSVRIDEVLAFAGDSIFRMPRMLARTLAELHALAAAPVLRL